MIGIIKRNKKIKHTITQKKQRYVVNINKKTYIYILKITHYLSDYMTHAMGFYFVLSTFLSYVATHLLLYMEFSYHIITRSYPNHGNYAYFLYRDILLGIRLLEQGLVGTRHHYRSFLVVIINSWIVPVYPSAQSKLIC